MQIIRQHRNSVLSQYDSLEGWCQKSGHQAAQQLAAMKKHITPYITARNVAFATSATLSGAFLGHILSTHANPLSTALVALEKPPSLELPNCPYELPSSLTSYVKLTAPSQFSPSYFNLQNAAIAATTLTISVVSREFMKTTADIFWHTFGLRFV